MDDDAPIHVPITSEMNCSSAQYLTTGSSKQVKYKPHKLFCYKNNEKMKWPIQSQKQIQCWHCISPVSADKLIPAPQSYDERTGEYTVSGIFCSFGCAKRYILERCKSNTTILLMYLSQMAREIFSFYDPIKPAPPQSSLDLFGGPLSLEEFHEFTISQNFPTVELHEPPFVSHVMLYNTGYEKSSSIDNNKMSKTAMAASAASAVLVEDNSKLKRPSLFENYLKKRTGNIPETTNFKSKTPSMSKKRRTRNLTDFFKKGKDRDS